jgi:hypothetical protein
VHDIHLIIETICAKYFQNPLNYEEVIDWTQNIPYNRLCKSLTILCLSVRPSQFHVRYITLSFMKGI